MSNQPYYTTLTRRKQFSDVAETKFKVTVHEIAGRVSNAKKRLNDYLKEFFAKNKVGKGAID